MLDFNLIRAALRRATWRRIKYAILDARYRDSGQVALYASITFKPFLMKNRDAVDTHAAAFRELVAHHTPEVEGALKIIEEAAKNEVFDKPVIDMSAAYLSASAKETTYGVAFKPSRAVLTEQIVATFVGKNLPDETVATHESDAKDILLSGLFSGSLNAFPNAPSPGRGIAGPILNNPRFFDQVDWPVIHPGIPVTADFSISPGVVCRRVAAPEGYHKIPRRVMVNVYMNLFGPQV